MENIKFCDSVVAFLDILGFKKIVFGGDYEKKLSEVVEVTKSAISEALPADKKSIFSEEPIKHNDDKRFDCLNNFYGGLANLARKDQGTQDYSGRS